jgi:histidyl-tRNA synthetase
MACGPKGEDRFPMATFRTVKGFRDLYPEDCASRDVILATWSRVARRYGFVPYEGPLVEATDLYRKKSGDEISAQLFCFEDKGKREITLRPEVTPSLARMATARQRDFRKPMKWFQIGSCFRYEEPQEGRSREFIQFNADIIGEGGPGADAELVALAIDTMLAFGIGAEDFAIRLSNRQVWTDFLTQQGLPEDKHPAFLQVIDKIQRAKPEETAQKLSAIGISHEQVLAFMNQDFSEHPAFAALAADLKARGLWSFIKLDASIVRGLAYYTGTVFEVFDLRHGLRAVAGGGRYDKLCALISDGAVDLPAAGFAMGDVVLGILLERTAAAAKQHHEAVLAALQSDVFVIIADEARRPEALGIVQALRRSGLRVDFSLSPQKVGKQFQGAEAQRARLGVVVGSEYPQLQLKDLISRQQQLIDASQLQPAVEAALATAPSPPLIAGA